NRVKIPVLIPHVVASHLSFLLRVIRGSSGYPGVGWFLTKGGGHMTHARTKIAVAALIVAAAVPYLAFAGIRKGWGYYVDVDQLVTAKKYSQQRVRVCGRVGEEGFDAAVGRLNANFVLLGKDHNVKVAYKGLVPDLFKVGTDVVIEGHLTPGTAGNAIF